MSVLTMHFLLLSPAAPGSSNEVIFKNEHLKILVGEECYKSSALVMICSYILGLSLLFISLV